MPQDDSKVQSEETNIEDTLGSLQAKTILSNDSITAHTSETNNITVNSTPSIKQRHPKHKHLIVSSGLAILAALIATGSFIYWRQNQPSSNTKANTSQVSVQKFGVVASLIEGTVESSKDAETWKTLTAETTLSEGDYVRTLTDGRTVLLIDDGSAIRLAANTKIQLSKLETTDVAINNLAGEVYTRVVAASTRKFAVTSGDESYEAKGTAYRTFNTSDKKGVEVYHSAVTTGIDKKEVAEGNALYDVFPQKEKEKVVIALDINELKNDEFIKWNTVQDKQSSEFSQLLGVLKEIEKPAEPIPAPAPPAPAPKSTAKASGITLAGSPNEYSANFSWSVSGIDTSKGYKLVKSKTSQTPTYPDNTAAYIEAGKTSYSLYLGDGKTYYFRICAYRGDTCDSYSNTVTVTTALKPQPEVKSGTITLSLAGTNASWTDTGTAPYGYKLVLSTTASPTYPSEFNQYTSSASTTIPAGLTSGSTYYLRACRYNDGSCSDYSNQLTYVAP